VSRKLRIAVSVFFGVLTLLLVATLFAVVLGLLVWGGE